MQNRDLLIDWPVLSRHTPDYWDLAVWAFTEYQESTDYREYRGRKNLREIEQVAVKRRRPS